MKIKKIGHCCLIIEINGKRIMTDPGSYTIVEQGIEKNIDLVLITHEHPDHLHIESIHKIISNNPQVKIITNTAVGNLLEEAGIVYEILEGKDAKDFQGISIEAHDCKHEEIFQDIGQVQNTAYFIDKRLFYPGDAFCNPGKAVEILALPVAGPWAKVKDFMNYVLEIKPKICFPVHDGMISPAFGSAHRVPNMLLSKFGIIFLPMEDKKEQDI